jgi:hypothetical protein
VIKTLFWIGIIVAAGVAVWSLLPDGQHQATSAQIVFTAETPWVIGNSADEFAYAGEGVHTIDGSVRLSIDPSTEDGLLQFDLPANAALADLVTDVQSQSLVSLRMTLENADKRWADQTIFGDSGVGDARLPSTFAQYAGAGSFELLIDGVSSDQSWYGFWSIADALRQSDGAIRDQGLVYSPLLRDKSHFSDPKRRELTLLVYAAAGSDVVVLDLVFSDVQSTETTSP